MTLVMIGTAEIIMIALIVLLLFGGKKIPELMRSLGKGMRSFQEGVKGVGEEVKNEDSKDSTNSATEDGCVPEAADESSAAQSIIADESSASQSIIADERSASQSIIADEPSASQSIIADEPSAPQS